DRIDQEHVEDAIARNRALHVVLDLDADRSPPTATVFAIDPRRDAEHVPEVGAVIVDVLPARLQEGPEQDVTVQLRRGPEQSFVREESPHDVLAEITGVDGEEGVLRPPLLDALYLGLH